MKIFYYFIILFLISGLFTACEDNTNNLPIETKEAEMSASIDNVEWTALDYGIYYTSDSIRIYGIGTNGEAVIITLQSNQTGTYSLGENSAHTAIYMPNVQETVTYSTGSNTNAGGTVIISEIDQTDSLISGSFNLTVYKNLLYKEITGGIFQYIKYDDTTANVLSNKFKFDLDTTSYAPETISARHVNSNIMVSATDGDYTVTLKMPYGIDLGSYEIGSVYRSVTGEYQPTAGTYLYADSGTLVITAYNYTTRRVKGAFTFKAIDILNEQEATIENGSFEVNYIEIE